MKRLISLLLGVILCFSLVSIANAEDARAVGDFVTFGTYEQDNDLTNGPEPIEWIVLDVKDGKAMLLSKYILDAKPFNEERNDHVWGTSTIRKWLNDEFINDAFTDDEQAAIIVTEVDNRTFENKNWYNGADDTLDSVFLLSYFEATDYNVTSTQSLNGPSEYAEPKVELYLDTHNGIRKADGDYFLMYWWLRTPGSWDKACVCTPSRISDYGEYRTSSLGIRPAMWVDLEKFTQPVPEPAEPESFDLIPLTASVTPDTTLADTPWKLWLPDGFEADELTEADLADHYIGYYLRDDDIIAVQYYDNTYSLADWQNELANRGFTVKGLYQINGAEAVLYQNEEKDFLTASVLDGKGKLLEVSFYPYSKMTEEADTVISSIQQETSRRKLSGAGGNTKATSDSATTTEPVGKAFAPQEEAYKAMVDAYKAGNYSDSYSYYEQAKGYQDSDKYGNLLKARLCYDLKLKDAEIEALEKVIVSDIDFADSKDVLVCNSAIAHYYLLGYWRTSNGMHGYEVRADRYSNTTVPAIPRSGDYYTIMDGIYWDYFDGKWDDRVAQYKFTPISKNKMEMYSYQAKQSYTFNKIR